MDNFTKFMSGLQATSTNSNFLAYEGASAPVRWEIAAERVDYAYAVARMEALAEEIGRDETAETVWLVEHPPLYTSGASAKQADLLMPKRFPVYSASRGGQYTYHGPGQRVCYVMLDLRRRKCDVRAFVTALEQWIIDTLAEFNVRGERRKGRVGVWVVRPERPGLPGGHLREDKIAAIGIRLRRWVSFHGVAINVEPELDHYSGIVPCGLAGHGVTSLADLGLPVSMHDVDVALKKCFCEIFGPVAG
jgi:lipoyl(octanoyl) transferase